MSFNIEIILKDKTLTKNKTSFPILPGMVLDIDFLSYAYLFSFIHLTSFSMTSIFSQDSSQENARLSDALHMADLGCWELSLLDRKFWMSERFQSHFKCTGGNIISYEDMMDLVHIRDRQNVRKCLEDVLTIGSDGKFDTQLRTQAGHLGSTCWVNWKGQVNFSPDGNPLYFSGIVQNITSQVNSSNSLVKSEAFSSNVSENSTDILSRWDLSSNRIWTNSAFDKKSGNFSGSSTAYTKAPPSNTEAYTKKFRRYLQKAIDSKTVQHCKPAESGSDDTLYASFLPEFDADREMESVLVVEHIFTDQTLLSIQQHDTERVLNLEDLNQQLAVANEEYTAANEELAEANLLLYKSNENLKQFAYVASHDLQEPLRKIQAFGDLLRKRISDNVEGIEYLDRMQHAAKRMSVLINDVLTFSHVSSNRAEFGNVDLNEVVEGVLTDLEISIERANAMISVSKLPLLKGDGRQLSQLFQNLLSNAIKFSRPHIQPQIRITWNIVKGSNLRGNIAIDSPARAYDRIDVSDNGIGFDKQHEERIFKVFQRLHGKSEYEGTGIGLAICEKVVTNHKGIIQVESQVGTGTTFSIYLPIL